MDPLTKPWYETSKQGLKSRCWYRLMVYITFIINEQIWPSILAISIGFIGLILSRVSQKSDMILLIYVRISGYLEPRCQQ